LISTLIRKKELVLLIGALSFGLQVAPASANTANLNFSNPTLDLSGNGSLDIASLLSLPVNTVANFTDGSATFNFTAGKLPTTFTNNSLINSTRYYNYQYNCGSQGCSTGSYLVTDQSVFANYNAPTQSATVAFGGTSTTSYSPASSITSLIQGNDAVGYVYNYRVDNNTDGSFSANLALDLPALNFLNSNGTLAFQSIFSNLGITLNSATFTGNYSVMAVPEPESYVMMFAGLGLLGFSQRRFLKK
jgi:hypothetical protein